MDDFTLFTIFHVSGRCGFMLVHCIEISHNYTP